MLRPLSLGLLVLSALAIVSCQDDARMPTAPSPSPTPTPSPSPTPTDAEVVAFVDLANAQRVSLGRRALVWNAVAAQVALAHSQDMATRSFFSHVNPDGQTPFDRMTAAGITFTTAGENIAWGFSTGQSVFDAWMASPGHRGNIENAAYTHHGVGRYGTYWTHVFFTPPSP